MCVSVCTCGKSGSEALSYNSSLCLVEDDDMRVCVCACVFEGSFGSYCQGQNELFISSVGGDTRIHTR